MEFLAQHSAINHNDVCLSFILTNRDFEDRSLGLAYTANPLKADEGGVCTRFIFPKDPLRDPQKSERQTDNDKGQSRNTGFVTFKSNNKDLPDQLTNLVFLHEIGHSLGSPHDFPGDCLKSRTSNGHYIMHPNKGVGGYLKSNFQFSPCSVRNISITLASLPRFGRDCLTTPPASVCGNGIIEAWEECDCGGDYETCDEAGDACCFPANHPIAPCTLKPRSQCSPSEGPCCSEDCKVVSKFKELECHAEDDCSYAMTCDGTGAKCPKALPKGDSTPCEGGSKLCQKRSMQCHHLCQVQHG